MAKGLGSLDTAWGALMGVTDRLDRLTTLVWLRQFMDPTMPGVAGFDPRTLGPSIKWEGELAPKGQVRAALDALCFVLNEGFGASLLSEGWDKLDEGDAVRAVTAVARWNPPGEDECGGDLLGEILQVYRPGATANGAYYTPYPVCRLMAMMNEAQPGESVCDPACGSGRMLLASLEVCRERFGGQPVLYGVDIDHDAIRACRLNLILAGAYSTVEPADSLVGRRMLKAASATTTEPEQEAA